MTAAPLTTPHAAPLPAVHARTETSDGLLLDALWTVPDAGAGLPGVDALLLVHGTMASVFAPGVLETFARLAAAAGTPVLRINTRGHDQMCWVPRRGGRSLQGGAAYEVVDDCRLDVQAWLDWLAERSLARIGLVGHSMGAVKSIYTAAVNRPASVVRVIGISPPRFCHRTMLDHADGAVLAADLQRAEQLAAAGRATELIAARFPLPMWISAGGMLDKYGPADRYDLIRHLPDVPCPVLVLVGSRSVETSMAFYDTPRAIDALCAVRPHVAFELLAGADTNYTGCGEVPFERARDWLQRLPQ